MKRTFTFGCFLLLALTLFSSPASAHWGDGDGHLASAIAEWGIILGSLGGTFYLIMRKKPIADNQDSQETSTETLS